MTLYEYLFTDYGRLIIASFLGAVLSAAMDYTGIWLFCRRILVGTIVAVHTYELAVPLTRFFLGLFDAPKEPSIALSGFLMGVMGVIFVETIILAGKKFRKKFDDN